MYFDFSKIFHRASKSLAGYSGYLIPKNSAEWPHTWKTTFYKSYDKMPHLPLPLPKKDSPFFTLIQNRESRIDFSATPISIDELSELLKYSCGETQALSNGRVRRAQPSGGMRFPIETYVLVFKDTPDLPAGAYHYNVQKHSLHVLHQQPFSKEDIAGLFIYEWVQGASIALVYTSVFSRSQAKYGQRGYRFILLEAGHIGQNVYLASESMGLICCALGATRDEELESFLHIDGESESVVYAIGLGKK